MQASSGPSGEALLAIAALAAIQLTAGKSDAQAAVLGAFFTMLGDAIPRGGPWKIPSGRRRSAARRFLEAQEPLRKACTSSSRSMPSS